MVIPGAFPAVVDEHMFARANRVFHDRTINKPDEYLVDALRRLLAKNGHLTQHMIDVAPRVPSPSTYRKRFGKLSSAYELIGYSPDNTRIVRQRVESKHRLRRLRVELLNRLRSMFGGRVRFRREPGRQRYLHLKCGADVTVTLCRAGSVPDNPVWLVDPTTGQETRVTLLCLLNEPGDGFHAFYVFPRLGRTKVFRIREGCDFLLRGKRLRNLREFYRAALEADRELPTSDSQHTPEMLMGLHEIASFFGRSLRTIQRVAKAGMPLVRQGRYITASPEELTRWAEGRRLGKGWWMNRPTAEGRRARIAAD